MSAISFRSPVPPIERILVLGGSVRTLDLLRLAVIRSDEIVAVHPHPDDRIRRFSGQFAVDLRVRDPVPEDLGDAAIVLIAIGDMEAENQWLRVARRKRIPVHVADRLLLSDFTLLDFVEQRPLALSAA